MEIRERIIAESGELFMRCGLKATTMDDVAKNLGISKKTIYKHFKNKNDLLEKIIIQYTDGDKCNMEKLTSESINAIDEIVKISKFIKIEMAKINAITIFELQKYYPTSWTFFQQHKQENLNTAIHENLEWGKNEGFYRNDVNSEILSILRVEQIELGLNSDIYPHSKFSILEVQMELLKHFILGIVTQKGLELYNKYISENE